MRAPRLVPLALACLLLSSCAWLRDRGADAADLFVLEGMLGFGVSADVKATELLHVGAGYAHGRKAGLRGRERIWMRDREIGFPASALLWVGALRELELWRLGHLHTYGSELWYGRSPWRLADVEVGVFAGFFGLRVGFSPGELIDFLAGWVGLDPAGDDAGPEPAPDDAPVEEGVWLTGDLHAHCDPPDGGHAPTTPAETRDLAAAAGMDFVGINPHLWFQGRAPAQREDLVAFAEVMRELEQEPGPLLIPGFEVMLRGRDWLDLDASGHVLLLFRDPADAYAFDDGSPDERSWVRRRLATLPREDRIWAPTHPWPHPRVGIPLFPDWAANWKQIDELPAGTATLGERTYAVWATAGWADREQRRGPQRAWRLVRYRRDPGARADLPAFPAGGGAWQTEDADWRVALARLLADLPAEVRAAGGEDLTAAFARELPLEVAHPLAQRPYELELALDVGRNAWLWARWFEPADGPGTLELTWGATPLDADGRAEPALHDVPVDGLETLSGLVHLASIAVGRRGDELDLEQSFRWIERRMLAEGRRVVPLAGSDNHRDMLFPTLWVFAAERSREAVYDALRQGRVCVGGPQTTSLRARSDRDPTWRAVGADLAADDWVELRWEGEAELFVNGESRGTHHGGYRDDLAAAPESPYLKQTRARLYRIARGPSRSGWIHVNLARRSRDPDAGARLESEAPRSR